MEMSAVSSAEHLHVVKPCPLRRSRRGDLILVPEGPSGGTGTRGQATSFETLFGTDGRCLTI